MTETPTNVEQEIYQIKIKGFLDEKWADWFDSFTITHHGENETMLIGPVSDQGALHGILAKIRDLGLPLLSVKYVPPEKAHEKKCK